MFDNKKGIFLNFNEWIKQVKQKNIIDIWLMPIPMLYTLSIKVGSFRYCKTNNIVVSVAVIIIVLFFNKIE